MYRVLVMEGDKGISNVMQVFLRDYKYDVLLAETAADAIRVITAEKLDAVILDQSLISDSEHFASLLRVRDVPVILCSTANDKSTAFTSVLVYRLKKPVKMNELLHVVKAACESKIGS